MINMEGSMQKSTNFDPCQHVFKTAILWNRRPTTPVSTETGRQTGAPKQLPVRKDWRSSAVVKKALTLKGFI